MYLRCISSEGFDLVLQELVLEGNPLQSPFDHLRREPYGDLAVVHFLHVDIGELDLTGASLVEVCFFTKMFAQSKNSDFLSSDPSAASSTCSQTYCLEFKRQRPENAPSQLRRVANVEGFVTRQQPHQVLFFLSLLLFFFLICFINREFPLEICQLTNLEVLTLDKNGVKCLPDSISDLQNLQTLVLDSNELICKLNLPSLFFGSFVSHLCDNCILQQCRLLFVLSLDSPRLPFLTMD